MQLFINNWASSLTLPATASAVQLSVPEADANLLTGLGTGDHYLLTLAILDVNGIETAWEVVRVTGHTAGVLDVLRAQEGTTALELEAATAIIARLTQATMETLRDSGGPTLSDSAPQALGAAAAGTSLEASRADHVHDLPTPADIGAVPASHVGAGGAEHADVIPGGAAGFMTGAQADKLAAIDPAATANPDTDSLAEGATNQWFTEGRVLATVLTGLSLAASTAVAATDSVLQAIGKLAARLALKEQTLTAGSNVTIDRTDPENPVISASITGGGGGDVVGPASSIANEVALFDGITGKVIKGGGLLGTAAAADTGDFVPASHVGAGGAAHGDVVASGAAGFMTGADKAKLDGVAGGATANPDTDSLAEGGTNKWFTEARVLATVLTGFSLASSAAVVATDTVIEAVGRLQKQINDLITSLAGKQATLVSGTNIKSVNGSSLLGAGDLTVSAAPAPVITESTTARTLALTGAGAYIRFTNASASTVTVPPQSSVAWAADTEIHIRRAAAGNLTLTQGAGVTLNAPSGGTLVMTNAMSVTLKRVGTDVWDVIGQTVAV